MSPGFVARPDSATAALPPRKIPRVGNTTAVVYPRCAPVRCDDRSAALRPRLFRPSLVVCGRSSRTARWRASAGVAAGRRKSAFAPRPASSSVTGVACGRRARHAPRAQAVDQSRDKNRESLTIDHPARSAGIVAIFTDRFNYIRCAGRRVPFGDHRTADRHDFCIANRHPPTVSARAAHAQTKEAALLRGFS